MGKKIRLEKKPRKKQIWLLGARAIDDANKILGTRIELLSNSEITVEGCLGVMEYTDTYLKLRLLKGSVIILGSDFDITMFEDKRISVTGKISSLEFCV